LHKTRVSAPLQEPLAKKVGQPLGSTWAQLLKRPVVGIEDLLPLIREAMPEFFERTFRGRAEESLPSPASPEWSSRPERSRAEELRPESSFPTNWGQPATVTNYDFSPEAHTRASQQAESRELLPIALPAFNVVAGGPADAERVQLGLTAEVRNELKSVETAVKYSGYLEQQQRAIERLKKAEQRRIPEWFDYSDVSGLSREMQEKLGRVRPQTIGQALAIPGVTPAAASLINIYIEIQGRKAVAG
jgi:hypothetical protein